MTHLTPDELIDAVEGLLTPERLEHLTTCAECQQQVADLSSVLSDAKQASIPEPSPLFWTHFSQRVSAAIDHTAAPQSGWPNWLRWPVLLPIGAVAMILIALMVSVPRKDSSANVAASVEQAGTEDLAASNSSDSWDTVADLVGEIDLDTAAAAGVIVEPGDVERAVFELTAEEQQELARLLQAELTRAKS